MFSRLHSSKKNFSRLDFSKKNDFETSFFEKLTKERDHSKGPWKISVHFKKNSCTTGKMPQRCFKYGINSPYSLDNLFDLGGKPIFLHFQKPIFLHFRKKNPVQFEKIQTERREQNHRFQKSNKLSKE